MPPVTSPPTSSSSSDEHWVADLADVLFSNVIFACDVFPVGFLTGKNGLLGKQMPEFFKLEDAYTDLAGTFAL